MVVMSVLFVIYFLIALCSPGLFANEAPSSSYPLFYLPFLLLTVLLALLGIGISKKRAWTIVEMIYITATAILIFFLYIWSFFFI